MTTLLEYDVPSVHMTTLAATLREYEVLRTQEFERDQDAADLDEDLARLERLIVALTRR